VKVEKDSGSILVYSHDSFKVKEIFGIKDFKIIEAETNHRGTITKKRTNLEKEFDYINLSQKGSREKYLKALSKCVELAEKPESPIGAKSERG